MKLLYMHAMDLRIEAGVNGSTPSKRGRNAQRLRDRLGYTLPDLDETNRKVEAKNALLALVCVERSDTKEVVREVSLDIVLARARVGAREIVVGSFAHLSENVACASLAREIIDRLVEEVALGFPKVLTFPFGWDKSLDLHIPLHHFNVSFRSFDASAYPAQTHPRISDEIGVALDDIDERSLKESRASREAQPLESVSGAITSDWFWWKKKEETK